MASLESAATFFETLRLPFVLADAPLLDATDDALRRPASLDIRAMLARLEAAAEGRLTSSGLDALAALCRMLLGFDEAARAVDHAQRRMSTLRESERGLRALFDEMLVGRSSPGIEDWPTTLEPSGTSALPFALGIVELPAPASLNEPSAAPPRLRVRLLGRFAIEIDGQSLPGWRSQRARRLFAYLALNRRDDVSRHRLMGLFWPDHSEQRAENNLSLAIMALRRLIDISKISPSSLIGFRAGCYFIDTDDVWLDTEEFAASVARAARLETQGELSQAAEAFDRAIDLYFGDLLPSELYEEWTIAARRQLQDLFTDAVQGRARLARAESDYDLSVRLNRRLLESDPANEEAHRQLMRDYLQIGQRSRAIAQMEACRQALGRHLGVGPDEETEALFARVTGRESI